MESAPALPRHHPEGIILLRLLRQSLKFEITKLVHIFGAFYAFQRPLITNQWVKSLITH